eukprot:scaffold5178_cov364-Prasinococcus_capsulatus_cf.AAC.8
MQRRHKSSPTATAAMGRALCGAALLGCFRGEDEMLQMNFLGAARTPCAAPPPPRGALLTAAAAHTPAGLAGDGPMGAIRVTGDCKGQVRVMCGNPQVELPLRPDGKLDVGSAVGQGECALGAAAASGRAAVASELRGPARAAPHELCAGWCAGTLQVVRSHPVWKEPFTGNVPIATGEAAPLTRAACGAAADCGGHRALPARLGADELRGGAGRARGPARRRARGRRLLRAGWGAASDVLRVRARALEAARSLCRCCPTCPRRR